MKRELAIMGIWRVLYSFESRTFTFRSLPFWVAFIKIFFTKNKQRHFLTWPQFLFHDSDSKLSLFFWLIDDVLLFESDRNFHAFLVLGALRISSFFRNADFFAELCKNLIRHLIFSETSKSNDSLIFKISISFFKNFSQKISRYYST